MFLRLVLFSKENKKGRRSFSLCSIVVVFFPLFYASHPFQNLNLNSEKQNIKQTNKVSIAEKKIIMSKQRPLIIFGLRGTLLERLHTARVPIAMPPASHTVGMHKVWVRNRALDSLKKLNENCDLAIWSSTTTRNTLPVVEAVFGQKPTPATQLNTNADALFKFVWSREQTHPDDFRRSAPVDAEDENATMKDLADVFKVFPQYSPERTVLVDDTPSKCRGNAGNFLWIGGLEGDANKILKDEEMTKLVKYVEGTLLKAKDVRSVLPHRL